ncbi:MAG TPA: glycosyltransferase family A protein, partial [Acidimicrobiales bacterium]|nr:glycosyltransferase family A protein [Acidimicrobiales bacterium]
MGTSGGGGGRTRVVVVAHDHADTITDCLDGIAAQGPGRSDVVVVDLGSLDGTTDVAIRHALPDRVAVTPPGDLDRILEVGSVDAPSDRIVVVGADLRPEPGWLDAAHRALDQHPLVL